MKTLLRKNKNSELDFLLQGSLYESLYAKITEALSNEEAATFCSIERRRNECLWYGIEQATYRPLAALSKKEKFELSDLLAETKANILPKLKADRVLATHAEMLFIVPAEDDIYQVKKADGTIGVALTRWAMKLALLAHDSDPIIKLINIPKPDHFPVRVAIRYSDGTPFTKTPFYFSYQDNTQKKFITNTEGEFNLGRLKNGRSFSISQFEDSKEYTYVVDEQQETYEVAFPTYINFEILTVNQEDEPVINRKLILGEGNNTQHLQTDENGIAYAKSFLLDNDRNTTLQTEDGEFAETYSLSRDTERIVFKLVETLYGDVSILVRDKQEQALSTYPVAIRENEEEGLYETNYEGKINLGTKEEGLFLRITDQKDIYNKIDHVVTKGAQEIILEVDPPVIPPVQVKLLDHKKTPLPAVPMDFNIGGNEHHEKTNGEGLVFLANGLFTHNEKVNVDIHSTNKKGRKKLIKKSFKYQEGLNEYTIRLWKFNWWLLLLLLPLLLLIRCEKTVYVKAVDNYSQPLSELNVNFSYSKRFLFDTGRFFTNDKMNIADSTSENGIAHFTKLEYSLYSFLLFMPSKALVYGNGQCLATDTLQPWFHFLRSADTLVLHATPIKTSLDFLLVDSLDGSPLANATAYIEANSNDQKLSFVSRSDSAGIVTFKNIPICGTVIDIIGSKEAYLPDSILNKEVEELRNIPLEDRQLRLMPELLEISFETVEEEDFNQIVPHAKLNFKVASKNDIAIEDKLSLPLQSDKSGKFNIKLPHYAKVSIVASKIGYAPNTTSVYENTIEELLSRSPEERKIPLKKSQPPREACRIFVSGLFVGDSYSSDKIGFSEIYKIDEYSEYVGEGSYPDNSIAFPKAVWGTFDGIAIDKGTRVIIYSQKNFQGEVLLDQRGPALINNIKFADYQPAKDWKVKTFKPPFEKTFPKEVRYFSKTDMHPWSYGSIQVICDE